MEQERFLSYNINKFNIEINNAFFDCRKLDEAAQERREIKVQSTADKVDGLWTTHETILWK